MIQITNLTKKYNKTIAVENLSLFIDSSTIAVIIGPNGAGKSTLFKSIVGLLNHDGEILINGFRNRSIEAKKLFSYVSESPNVYPFLTVREHIEYTLKAYKKDLNEEDIERLLKRYDLLDKSDKFGNQLSKGMMQKVNICCAFITKPKILILDEPMVGLDPIAIKRLKEDLLEFSSNGTTVVISTHMLDMVNDIFEHMILLKDGQIVKEYHKKGQTIDLDDMFFEYLGVTDE